MATSSRLIEYELDDGKTILVEVAEPVLGGLAPVCRTTATIVKAQSTLSEAVGKVRPIAESIINNLSSVTTRPDEISVEFGLKLSSNAGAVLATVGMECNYVIKMTWKKDSMSDSTDAKCSIHLAVE